MRLSQLFSKTTKQTPADEVSVNAKLLIQAGFIDKVAAGVYTFLPLGIKVISKISQIVREEMIAIDGQEVLMPALEPKENWEATGRWAGFDVLFKVKGAAGEFALGPSHEEIVVPLAKRFVLSYADLPKAVFQIQTKFRDEPRAKAGLLRGREFLMKDLYSFHTTEEDFKKYYERAKGAYRKVFERVGLDAIETEAAGGTFSKFSDEYQVVCESGEDEIIYCPGGDFSQNLEIIEDPKKLDGKQCDLGHGPLKRVKTIEVGNIFPLKDKYSKAFNLMVKDANGKSVSVQMGCYGIGISRLMGAIVEVYHDEHGIIWPKAVSPYKAHLVQIGDDESLAKEFLEACEKNGLGKEDILWDDRTNVSAGEKFADCDLIGIPVRLVVSEKVGNGKVEWKARNSQNSEVITIESALEKLK